jgi:RNA polymerase sigma factor (sigma-70 family)
MKDFTPIYNDSVCDHDLWSAFKEGDRTAFAYVYQKHFRQLISYGFKVTRDKNVVKDCIQDLFVELWEKRKNLTNVNSIQFYLLKSLRYKIIRNLEERNEDPLDKIHSEIDESNFELEMLQGEVDSLHSRQLHIAINLLPKRQREAIQLRYFHNMSNDEVANIMGVNYQSACKFIYSALKSLRDIMHLSSFLPLIIPFFHILEKKG